MQSDAVDLPNHSRLLERGSRTPISSPSQAGFYFHSALLMQRSNDLQSKQL